MIRSFSLFFWLLISSLSFCYCQTSVKVTYKIQSLIDFDTLQGPQKFKNILKNSLNKSQLLGFFLRVDARSMTSSFGLEKSITPPSINGMNLTLIETGANIKGIYVFSDDKLIHLYDALGTDIRVLVQEPVIWTKTTDQKLVNGYRCYKAIGHVDYGKSDIIEAWYTQEIPLSFGPKIYSGLPGLILEVQEKNWRIKAENIEFVDKVKVKVPDKSQLLSEKEADSILALLEEKAESYFKN